MKVGIRFAKGREKSICTKFDKLVSKKRINENPKSKQIILALIKGI